MLGVAISRFAVTISEFFKTFHALSSFLSSHFFVPRRPAGLADALAGTEGIKGQNLLAPQALLLPIGGMGVRLLLLGPAPRDVAALALADGRPEIS